MGKEPKPDAPPAFYDREAKNWEHLKPNAAGGAEEQKEEKSHASARKPLHDYLLASLQMQHVMVLAGSGTSLGPVGGPSMGVLWKSCVTENSGAADVIETVGYDEAGQKENIEALLSQCEAYLQIKPDQTVLAFVNLSKKTILEKCSTFVDSRNPDQLKSHRTFLHRLSRRRVRDSRLKLFTTNYDLCFEAAAAKQGLVVVDGFSFSQPRCFDPRFFLYDIVRRTPAGGELGTPLEGVFQLYKLHGSVNWSREASGDVVVVDSPKPEDACLIYPAKGKYQQSFIQPHLELVSQYFASLREPNTCVVAIGFGFNDDHLSEPLLAAVRTNPYLRLVIVSLSAKTDVEGENRYWKRLYELATQGADILLVASTFAQFAELIPDLKSLTPAEQLAKSVKALAGGH